MNNLVYLVTEYDLWKNDHEINNSLLLGEIAMVDEFRKNRLIPYYTSMSGGGSRVSAAPVVNEFLDIYDRLHRKYLPEISKINREVIELLGNTVEEKLDVLNSIFNDTDSLKNYPHLHTYWTTIKNKMSYKEKMDLYHTSLINAQIPILRAAIDSRNIVALKAAMNPGWGSLRFAELPEYKQALSLVTELEMAV